MTFESPEWFLLIPCLIAITLIWRHLALWKPLRLLCIAAIILILANPRISKLQNALDLYVLLDRSESTEDIVDKNLPEWKRLLDKHKPSSKDRIRYFNFANELSEESTGELASYTGKKQLTRTNLALDAIVPEFDKKRPSRVLIFTDGYATEQITEAAEKFKKLNVPIDFRLIRDSVIDDYRISNLTIPSKSQSGEPFVISVTVRGHEDISIPLEIFRDDQLLTSSEVKLTNGVGKVEFTDRVTRPGSYKYKAVIRPKIDAQVGNNTYEQWIEITGGPKVLLVTKYINDPLAAVLESKGMIVETVANSMLLKVGQLTGTRLVILNNVPAYEMPSDFMSSLNFFVKEQAGGLMMVGGEQSFGSGGYFNSEIDPLLPISMELKNEHRKLNVALAITMDRSGSMMADVGGGLTKMDLADNGAAAAVELLGPMDSVTVFAVDSEAHKIVPLTQIKNDKVGITKRIKKIQSEGGGIFVFNGLNAAWLELQKAQIGTKHIILFSDAADSEEPGRYKELIADIVKKGGTISVIGMGTDKDPDAELLKDIAKLGNGRMFFTDKAMDLPKIFAQETVTIARSAFIDEATGTKPTGKWTEISPSNLNWLHDVDGYNLSYLRDDATASLISTDEYLAPLIAHANRGLGRTAAISFKLGGEQSNKVRAWSQYGDFIQTTCRWLMGDDLPPGIALRTKVDGTNLNVDLLYSSEKWSETFAKSAPKIRLSNNLLGEKVYDGTWRRLSPGIFTMQHGLDEGSVVRGVVRAGTHALPFGPLTIGGNSEWAFDATRIEELRSCSSATKGRELLDLSKAWLRPEIKHEFSLIPYLAIFALLTFLIDALLTRTGWKIFSFNASKEIRQEPLTQPSTKPIQGKEKKKATVPKVEEVKTIIKPDVTSPNIPTPSQTQPKKQSSLDRAKKGR